MFTLEVLVRQAAFCECLNWSTKAVISGNGLLRGAVAAGRHLEGLSRADKSATR